MTPDLGMWSRRMPLAVLSVLTAVPLFGLLVAETLASPVCSPDNPCRAVLHSVTYWTDAPVVFVAYALIFLPFLFPRAGVWCALGLAVAVLVGAGVTSYWWGWAVAACWWAVLAGLDVAGRRRQRRLSLEWAAVQRPDLPGRKLGWDEDTRRLGWLVALVLLLGAAVLVVVHSAQLRDVEQFEATATRAVGTVTNAGIDGPLVLQVDGRSYEIDWTVESYQQGASLPVLLDARTGRISLVAEPPDPSWLLGCVAVAVVLAGCAWSVLWSRGRRRAELMRDGGPAVRLLLTEGRYTTFGDSTLGSRFGRFVTGELVPVADAFVDDPDQPGPRRALGRPFIPLDTAALPGPEQLSDDEVRAWADDLDDLDDEEGQDDEARGLAEPRFVTVIGRLVDGHPILVQDGSHLLLSSRAVRDPWLFRRLIPRRSTISKPQSQPDVQAHQRRDSRWPSRLSLPLALLLAIPAGAGLWWLFDDPMAPLGWADAIPFAGLTVALATGLHRLAETGQPILTAHPAGLQLRGPFAMTVLRAHRVVDVITARNSVVLRLQNPDDLIDVHLDTIAGHWPAPSEAAAQVRQWLNEASTTPIRPKRRPSLSLAPPGLLLVTVALSALLTT